MYLRKMSLKLYEQCFCSSGSDEDYTEKIYHLEVIDALENDHKEAMRKNLKVKTDQEAVSDYNYWKTVRYGI